METINQHQNSRITIVIDMVRKLLANASLVGAAIFLISLFSLSAALVAQYAFKMTPCPLCLLQRIPYAAAMAFGFTAFLLSAKGPAKSSAYMIFLCALVFAVNAAIAFYHNGVEQHWWVSAIEGCTVPIDPATAKTFLEKIQVLAPARCDQIPWSDPVFHLSMAAWNILMSAGLASVSLASFVLILRQSPHKPQPWN